MLKTNGFPDRISTQTPADIPPVFYLSDEFPVIKLINQRRFCIY